MSELKIKLREKFSFLSGNFRILLISLIPIEVGRSIPMVYYSLFVLALGGTPSIVGIIGVISLAVMAFMQFPGGFLADKYGRKWFIVTFTFAFGMSYFFYAIANDWRIILVGAVLQNLFLIYQPALGAMMADALKPIDRGTGFSITISVPHAITLFSPIIAGFMVALYDLVLGIRISYIIAMLLSFVSAIIRVKLRETWKQNAKKVDFREILTNYPGAIKESICIWNKVPRPMFYLLVIFVMFSFFSGVTNPYYVVYATSVLNVEKFQYALLSTFFLASTFFSALPCGKLIDKIGRKKPLTISFFLFIPAMWLFLYGDLMKLYLCFFLVAVGSVLFSISYLSLRADFTPRKNRGRVIGSLNFFGVGSMALGQLVGGVIYEKMDPRIPFLLPIVFAITCLLITLHSIHEPEEREV